MTALLGSGPLVGWRIFRFPSEDVERTARAWILQAIQASTADDLRLELDVLGHVVDGRPVAEHVAIAVLDRLTQLRAELGGPPPAHERARLDGYHLLRPTIDDAILDAEKTLGPVQLEDTGDEVRASWASGELMVFRRHGGCDAFWKDVTAEVLDAEEAAAESEALLAQADGPPDEEPPEGPSGTTLDAEVEEPAACGVEPCAATENGMAPCDEDHVARGVSCASAPPSDPSPALVARAGLRESDAEPLAQPEKHDPARVEAAVAVRQLADERRRAMGDLPTLGELAKASTQGRLAANRANLRTVWEQLRPRPESLAVVGLCAACARPCTGYLSKEVPGDGVNRAPMFGHSQCVEDCCLRLERGGSSAGPYGDMILMRAELKHHGVALDGGEVFLELQALVLDARRAKARREIDWSKARKGVTKRGRKDPCVLCGQPFVAGSAWLAEGSHLAHEACAATLADEPAPASEPVAVAAAEDEGDVEEPGA